MRPSLSFIDESGRPSMVKRGKPDEVSASTRMRCASAPTTAAVNDVASMGSPWPGTIRARTAGSSGKAGGEPASDARAYVRARPGRVRWRLANGVDGEGVAGGQQGPAQVVPRHEVGHGGVVALGE